MKLENAISIARNPNAGYAKRREAKAIIAAAGIVDAKADRAERTRRARAEAQRETPCSGCGLLLSIADIDDCPDCGPDCD